MIALPDSESSLNLLFFDEQQSSLLKENIEVNYLGRMLTDIKPAKTEKDNCYFLLRNAATEFSEILSLVEANQTTYGGFLDHEWADYSKEEGVHETKWKSLLLRLPDFWDLTYAGICLSFMSHINLTEYLKN